MIFKDDSLPVIYVSLKQKGEKSGRYFTLYGITADQLMQKLREMSTDITQPSEQPEPTKRKPATTAA